jgi:DNA primase catalytic core
MKTFSNLQGAKEYVRENSDLMQVIDEDVGEIDWKEESNGTYICCSPFREEDNPSFKVSNNRFKDWGGEQNSGDIFSWAQLWHNLSFPEAVSHIAERFRIDLTPFHKDPTQEEIQRARYIRINNQAAEIMHGWLRENIQVRDDYLSRSGFNLDQINPYLVGYCADKDLLVAALSKELHISQEDIDKLEFYRTDLFNNAIIYPIHNHHGDVVGFYTKQLGVEDAPYKGNKSDHPLHDPGVLYGLHVARRDIRKNNGRLAIVEGFRDAIATKFAGCMGSSLTDPQLENLRQYKLKTIVACYDGDRTGWVKSLDLVNKPQDVGEALLLVARPDVDVDPHDVWREGGDEAIYALLKSAELPIEHYARTKFANVEGNLSYTDKETMFADLKEFLVGASGIHLDMAADYLAKLINSTKEAVIDYVAEIKAKYNELFNIEAERALIAYCMDNPPALSAAKAAGIIAEAFTKSHFAKLFAACEISHENYGDNYTPQVVLDEAMAKNPNPELPTIVVQIQEGEYRYTEGAACEKVLDMWRRRTASEQASKLITSARDLSQPFSTIVESHRKHLISTSSSSKPQARTPQELANEMYEEVKERNRSGGNLIIGHSFHHMPSIDLVLGGIQPHYTVIGGDSGAGKSLVAMNLAKCVAIDKKIPTLWVGQEMRSKDNIMRLTSMLTGIDNIRMQSGNLSQKEAEEIREAKEIIGGAG